MIPLLSYGDIAPAFTLTDDHGQQVSLSDFAGQRVIVYFYPAALTPGCTTQAVDFSAAGRELEARSEEHTSELQSLLRISYAVFCLKKTLHTIANSMYTC